MNDRPLEINKVAVGPIDCIAVSWEVIRPQYGLFLGITFVGMLIGGAVPLILTGPMMCGIYLCMLQMLKGQTITFETLFKGFDHFVQSLIACLIPAAIMVALIVPIYIFMFLSIFTMSAGIASESPALALAPLLTLGIVFTVLMVLAILVNLLLIFSFILIVDKNMSGPASLLASAKAVLKNFWGCLGLVIVTQIVSFVGILCCFVGAFLVYPITVGALVVAYRKIFPEVIPEPPALPAY